MEISPGLSLESNLQLCSCGEAWVQPVIAEIPVYFGGVDSAKAGEDHGFGIETVVAGDRPPGVVRLPLVRPGAGNRSVGARNRVVRFAFDDSSCYVVQLSPLLEGMDEWLAVGIANHFHSIRILASYKFEWVKFIDRWVYRCC